MIEDTLPMALGDVVVPTIQLPAKPPPSRAGYFSGSVGALSAASALNFSNVGLFNDETLTRSIVVLRNVLITNVTGAATDWEVRRLDVVSGFTFAAGVPLYVNAGLQGTAALGRVVRNNSAVASGTFVTIVTIPDLTTIKLELNAVINAGAVLISGSAINREVRATIQYDVYPILNTQVAG